MQKTLIELESKIHSLQCATNDDRDKFIFQICRQLIQDKIDNQFINERIVDTNKMITSQTEISDEEIEKAAAHHEPVVTRRAWISACKWYREQLKSK